MNLTDLIHRRDVLAETEDKIKYQEPMVLCLGPEVNNRFWTLQTDGEVYQIYVSGAVVSQYGNLIEAYKCFIDRLTCCILPDLIQGHEPVQAKVMGFNLNKEMIIGYDNGFYAKKENLCLPMNYLGVNTWLLRFIEHCTTQLNMIHGAFDYEKRSRTIMW